MSHNAAQCSSKPLGKDKEIDNSTVDSTQGNKRSKSNDKSQVILKSPFPENWTKKTVMAIITIIGITTTTKASNINHSSSTQNRLMTLSTQSSSSPQLSTASSMPLSILPTYSSRGTSSSTRCPST